MTTSPEIDINNSGNNQGAMVGYNYGTISMSIKKTVKIPSLIAIIVQSLGSKSMEVNVPYSDGSLQEFKPDEKLEYNSVIKYIDIIREFSAYYLYCDNILNQYDNTKLGSKARILNCIHMWYLEEKGSLLLSLKDVEKTNIEKIQEHADDLIDRVKTRIRKTVQQAEVEDTCVEDIEIGSTCFLCYCFMECKILEKPI